MAEFTQRRLGGHGYIVYTTGNVVGLSPSCKVGDVVIRFPADHAFAGHRVVIEAKRDRSYILGNALEEIAPARPPGFPTFSRYANDIVVVWDETDPSTDPYLQAALMVGLALATRTKVIAIRSRRRMLKCRTLWPRNEILTERRKRAASILQRAGFFASAPLRRTAVGKRHVDGCCISSRTRPLCPEGLRSRMIEQLR